MSDSRSDSRTAYPNPLIFVDCETYGPCPATGVLTEFGAVESQTHHFFHGVIVPRNSTNAAADPLTLIDAPRAKQVFTDFAEWLKQFPTHHHPIFVSDNPAWDFQWITDGFWRYLGTNPFGHSARRISDYYAGLTGDWKNTQEWKRLRVTPHDHNPVHDAMGNLEAWERMQKGERGKR